MTVYVIANGERAGLIVSDEPDDNLPDVGIVEHGEVTLLLDGGIVFIKTYPELFKLYGHTFTRHGGKKYGGLRWRLGKIAFNLRLTKSRPDCVRHVVKGSNKPLITFGLPDWRNQGKANAREYEDLKYYLKALLLYANKSKAY